MSAVKYDLAVIGSGPSGQRAAVAAAKMKKRVVVVEARSVVGGVCINTGTIPSKTMREAVLHLSGYNYRSIYGMNYRVKEKITMGDLAFRVQAVIKTEVDVTEAQLSRNGIDVVHGIAHFVDAQHIRVEGPQGDTTLESDRIIIAVGTRPASSPRVPINGKTIVNSDQILDLPALPRSMMVVGGGVVGVEYACMFAILGVRVTVIEKRPKLLEFADQEIVEALSYHLRDSRVTLRLGEEVEGVEELPDGTVVANLESKKRISGDALYAVGRQGAVEDLNLGAAGIEADARGRIPVDESYRTKVNHIFAVGDVVGFPALASVSMEQGRIAAHRAFNDTATTSNPSFYPYGIYTIPEISFIGKTEEQLTDEDVPYEVGMAYYREVARGQIRGDTTGRLKLIFHRETRKVLGVHIIGEGAAELVHIGQAVMTLDGTVDYFVETVFNYPTLAECYKVAAFNGLGRLMRYQAGAEAQDAEDGMTNAIGVVMTEHIVAGRLQDHKLVGEPVRFPADQNELDALQAIPSGELVDVVARQVAELAGTGGKLDAIGVAVPGVVRHNIVEESPNLKQLKGVHLGQELGRVLAERGIAAPVHIANDADAIAAGVAATRGHLNRLTRVWTIGNGIGYGRWPYVEGVWEGGHITVSLDPRERFCGCGGVGHLEGIMGYRAMRLRFLDKEPEEVFAAAKEGDATCREFVDLWHRALAAATASFIHLAGPGKFYFTGHNVGFLDVATLRAHMETMVKMSPLQSFSLEVLEPDDETALIGAGVSALRALTW